MKNVKAILISNSEFKSTDLDEFMEAQQEMKNPIVLFVDGETEEVQELFWIEAEDMDDLKIMYKVKIFYTSSIPEGEKKSYYDALFLGVRKGKFVKDENVILQTNA